MEDLSAKAFCKEIEALRETQKKKKRKLEVKIFNLQKDLEELISFQKLEDWSFQEEWRIKWRKQKERGK
jgi:hypothetical protein